MRRINKILIFLIIFFIFSCNSVKNTVYTVEMTLINGDLITRHYILEDSIKLFLKNRRGKSFLVYDKKDITRYPFILKKNVVSFKLKKTK